jgi:transcriptional regulator with XRE-family HTH domain
MYALAKTAGITQTQLAKGLGLHKTTVNHWFLGDRFLDDKWAAALATLLHEPLSEIRRAYEQRALPQFKRQPPSSSDEASLDGQKPPHGFEVASRSL